MFPTRFYVGLALAALAFLSVATASIYTVKRVFEVNEEVRDRISRETLLVERIQFYNAAKARQMPAYILSGDPSMLTVFRDFHQLFSTTLTAVDALAPAEDRPALAIIRDKADQAYAMHGYAQQMLERGDRPRVVDKFFREHVRTITRHVDVQVRELAAELNARRDRAHAQIRSTTKRLITVVGALALLTFVVTAYAARMTFRVLKQKRRLDESVIRISTARKDVVEVLAHDIKSPVAVISSVVQLMREDATDADLQRFGPSFDILARSAGVISTLTSNLLDHAKIESGHFRIEPRCCAITDIMSGVVERYRVLAKQRNVTLTAEMCELGQTSCDAVRLDQAFSNLVGNAVKFSREGGVVKIKCARVEAEIVISVQDSGPGLSDDQIDHVFDRYWQANSTGRAGTGLGLAIVKSIAEAHRGRLWVSSAPDQGARFFMALPT